MVVERLPRQTTETAIPQGQPRRASHSQKSLRTQLPLTGNGEAQTNDGLQSREGVVLTEMAVPALAVRN